jgi:hypothetical protein
MVMSFLESDASIARAGQLPSLATTGIMHVTCQIRRDRQTFGTDFADTHDGRLKRRVFGPATRLQAPRKGAPGQNATSG